MESFVRRSSIYRRQALKHRGWRRYTSFLKLMNIGAAIFFLIFTVAPSWTSAGDDSDIVIPSIESSPAMSSSAFTPMSTPTPTSFMPPASSVLPLNDVIGRTLNTIQNLDGKDGIQSAVGRTGGKRPSDDGGAGTGNVNKKDGMEVEAVFSGRWNVASRSVMNLEGDIGKEDALEVRAGGQKDVARSGEKFFSNKENSESPKENLERAKAENQRAEGSGTKTLGQDIPDFGGNFPDGEIANKFLTDVRVIEGEVYVVDYANTMSLLDPGTSMRVFFKERPASNQAGEPVSALGVFTDKVQALAVLKTNPPPVMVVKADPVMPVAKDDVASAFVRDDTAAMNVDLPAGVEGVIIDEIFQ
ncbi:MAG: hypothetical protein WCJ71_03280 [Candidatus Omnitrophota bacterium]